MLAPDLSALQLENTPITDDNGITVIDRFRYFCKAESERGPTTVIIKLLGSEWVVLYSGCKCTVYGEIGVNTIATALAFCGFKPAVSYGRKHKIDNLLNI